MAVASHEQSCVRRAGGHDCSMYPWKSVHHAVSKLTLSTVMSWPSTVGAYLAQTKVQLRNRADRTASLGTAGGLQTEEGGTLPVVVPLTRNHDCSAPKAAAASS